MTRSAILLTGATGFIGTHMRRRLVLLGRSVLAISRSADRIRVEHPSDHVEWIEPGAVTAAMLHDVACVMHLATEYDGNSIARIHDANVAWPVSLLETACDAGVPHFIAADSFFSRERFDYQHMLAYVLGKRQFRQWGALVSNGGRIRYSNLFLEHVYGPNDGSGKFVPTLKRALTAGDAVFPCTEGSQKRDFIEVADVVSAFEAVMNGPSEPCYVEHSVGTGQSVPLADFVRQMKRRSGASTELAFGAVPMRDGEIMDSSADTSSLRALGWAPRLDHVAGIDKLFAAEAGSSGR